MTENQEDKKVKKLKLGSTTKLSLVNYPNKKGAQTLGSPGSIVVEVKRGKATTSGLSLKTVSSSTPQQSNIEQDIRRMEALHRSKISASTKQETKFVSLSMLSEINQEHEVRNRSDIVNSIEEEVVQENISSFETENIQQTDTFTIKIDPETVEEEKSLPTKPKSIEPKKLKKSDIIHMLDEDLDTSPVKTRSLASIKRAKEKEKRKNTTITAHSTKVYRDVILAEVITVSELSNKMSERTSDVIKELMKLGVIVTSQQSIDADTAELVATSLGHNVKRVKESDIEDTLTKKSNNNNTTKNLVSRAPIVTVMGHVDHGKTTLLDALKSTDIVSSEMGGITQHIGAYTITTDSNKMITFIDTPGHEAFTAMRTRGAQVTDIVILVVAADDGIKAQTIEAINHAKAAEVPIIVAINKIDKPEADINKVKTELLNYELIAEDLGGDVIIVGVSAKHRKNLKTLEEAILLVAEMQELKANPDTTASGIVVESRIDQSQGVIATMIIQQGTLYKGDIIIAGTTHGRVRRLCNDKGNTIAAARPAIAVEVYGLQDIPSAGHTFHVVATEKQARDIVEYRQRKARELQFTTSKTSLEELFLKASGNANCNRRECSVIIKGDVHGSIEAIIASCNKITNDEITLKILHSAVGGINESDVNLAHASGASVLGFNVRANNAAINLAKNHKVDIRYYSIIYHLIDDIKGIMSGLLSPIIREQYIGSVVIREVFNISKIGKVAGSYVTKGIIKRGAGMRLLRNNIVIHEGKLKTLKRFKDDVKEVKEGFECGIAFENYNDIKIADSVEVFEIVEEQKKL